MLSKSLNRLFRNGNSERHRTSQPKIPHIVKLRESAIGRKTMLQIIEPRTLRVPRGARTLTLIDITGEATELEAYDGHEQVWLGRDIDRSLTAIVAIHDTTLGPALGGTRVWPHESFAATLTDALRLSRGMTYKAAVTGVPFGGGKAVIMADPKHREIASAARGLCRHARRSRRAVLHWRGCRADAGRRRLPAKSRQQRDRHDGGRQRQPLSGDRAWCVPGHARRRSATRPAATTSPASGWPCRGSAPSASRSGAELARRGAVLTVADIDPGQRRRGSRQRLMRPRRCGGRSWPPTSIYLLPARSVACCPAKPIPASEGLDRRRLGQQPARPARRCRPIAGAGHSLCAGLCHQRRRPYQCGGRACARRL